MRFKATRKWPIENCSILSIFVLIYPILVLVDFCRDVNIMDNIMALIEQHTDNLEALVEERTRLLMEEKKKTDKLLYKILPV